MHVLIQYNPYTLRNLVFDDLWLLDLTIDDMVIG